MMAASSSLGAGRCTMFFPTELNKIENIFGSVPVDVSPLSTAVLCDDLDGVHAELAKGADPNRREPDGGTPVLFAAGLSRDAILRKLLDAGGDPNSFETDSNFSALTYALSVGIWFQDWRAYYTLLERGADVNFKRDGLSTVAQRAAVLGQFEKVLELLDRGYRHDLERLEGTLGRLAVSDKALPARDRALARVRELIAAGESRTAPAR